MTEIKIGFYSDFKRLSHFIGSITGNLIGSFFGVVFMTVNFREVAVEVAVWAGRAVRAAIEDFV